MNDIDKINNNSPLNSKNLIKMNLEESITIEVLEDDIFNSPFSSFDNENNKINTIDNLNDSIISTHETFHLSLKNELFDFVVDQSLNASLVLFVISNRKKNIQYNLKYIIQDEKLKFSLDLNAQKVCETLRETNPLLKYAVFFSNDTILKDLFFCDNKINFTSQLSGKVNENRDWKEEDFMILKLLWLDDPSIQTDDNLISNFSYIPSGIEHPLWIILEKNEIKKSRFIPETPKQQFSPSSKLQDFVMNVLKDIPNDTLIHEDKTDISYNQKNDIINKSNQFTNNKNNYQFDQFHYQDMDEMFSNWMKKIISNGALKEIIKEAVHEESKKNDEIIIEIKEDIQNIKYSIINFKNDIDKKIENTLTRMKIYIESIQHEIRESNPVTNETLKELKYEINSEIDERVDEWKISVSDIMDKVEAIRQSVIYNQDTSESRFMELNKIESVINMIQQTVSETVLDVHQLKQFESFINPTMDENNKTNVNKKLMTIFTQVQALEGRSVSFFDELRDIKNQISKTKQKIKKIEGNHKNNLKKVNTKMDKIQSRVSSPVSEGKIENEITHETIDSPVTYRIYKHDPISPRLVLQTNSPRKKINTSFHNENQSSIHEIERRYDELVRQMQHLSNEYHARLNRCDHEIINIKEAIFSQKQLDMNMLIQTEDQIAKKSIVDELKNVRSILAEETEEKKDNQPINSVSKEEIIKLLDTIKIPTINKLELDFNNFKNETKEQLQNLIENLHHTQLNQEEMSQIQLQISQMEQSLNNELIQVQNIKTQMETVLKFILSDQELLSKLMLLLLPEDRERFEQERESLLSLSEFEELSQPSTL